VGIELTGGEAKSFYEGRVILSGSYVKILSGELYLVNAKFTWPTVPATSESRSRRLLAKKQEIRNWAQRMSEKKLTIVPVSMYTRGRFIKLKIALSRSQLEFDKRARAKKRVMQRENEQDVRIK